jgi:hypothetical protein
MAGSRLTPVRSLHNTSQPEVESAENSSVTLYNMTLTADDPQTPISQLQSTLRLWDTYARLLGLETNPLEITIGGKDRLDKNQAGGMVDRGAVYLHPRHFNPYNHNGRMILAHELAHIAQQRRNVTAGNTRAGVTMDLIEKEASATARKVVAGYVPEPLQYLLHAEAIAYTDPVGDESEPQPSEETFLDAVRTRYAEEIARINRLLRGVWGFLWVTDGMVNEILLILQSVDFITVQAIVQALTTGKKRTLVSNISSGHFGRYRTQILAIYGVVDTEIIEDHDEDLFDGMNWSGFSSDEHSAIVRVREIWLAMGDQNPWQKLRADDQVGEAVRRMDSLGDPQLTDEDIARRRGQEYSRISNEIEQRNNASSVALADDELGDAVRNVIRLLRAGTSDDERLIILDYLRPALREPDRLRSIAYVLEHHEDGDLIERLVDGFPVTRLYQGAGDEQRAGSERLAGETRLTVLLRLVSCRAPWRNIRLAEDLLDTSFFSFDWMVNDEEAYLAHMLAQSVPESMRAGFLSEHQATIDSNVTQSMRESSRWNFYTGGEGRLDQASIQAQLMDPQIWTVENIQRLSGLLRMAIMAGEHRFVFNLSYRQYISNREVYRNEEFTRQIVEMYQLYNPHARNAQGEPVPREEYSAEYIESMPWYREGMFSIVSDYAVQGLDFIFSSDNVEVLTNSIGGTGLNAAEFQDMFGGSFMGIRFERLENLGEEGQRAREEQSGVNFIDRVAWDQNEGVLEVEANDLAIASIRYPVGSLLFCAGTGRLRGLDLHITYPTVYNTHPMSLALSVSSLELNDSTIVMSDSMVAIEEIHLDTLEVNMGRDAILGQQDRARGGLDPGAVLFTFIMPGIPSLLQILRIPMESSDSMLGSILEPQHSSAITVQWRDLQIRGITTSSGMYIDSIQLENFQLGIAGSRQDYIEILFQSYRTLTDRWARLTVSLQHADNEESRRSIQEQIDRINAQREAVWNLKNRIIEAQEELDQITRERQRNPESYNPPAQERAGELIRFLRTFDRGGVTLDSGRITIRGLQGGTELDELELSNVHGSGTSAAGVLSALTDSNVLTRIAGGRSYRPPVVPGLEHEESTFELDIGDIDIENLTIRSGIPTEDDAQRDLDDTTSDLRARPWDPNLRREQERLVQRLANVREYRRLASIGATYLTSDEQRRFTALRDSLMREEAFYAAHITSRGTRLEMGRDGSTIGFHSEQFDAFRPVDENGMPIADAPGIRAGDLSIGEIHSRDFRFNIGLANGLLDESGSLAGEDDLRRRLTSIGFSGEDLQFIDVVHNRQNIAVDSAELERFGITYRPQDGVLEVEARRASVQGFSHTITEEFLQREIESLEAIPANRISSSEQQRLTQLREALDQLRGFYQLFDQMNQEIEQATSESERSRLQGLLADAILMHQEWLRQIGARSIDVHDLGARVSGIGNVLDPDFDVDAMLEEGITIEGTGRSQTHTTGIEGEARPRTDRIFSSARITETRFGQNTAQEIVAGETGGRIRYGSRLIGIDNVYIDQFTVTNFSLLSRNVIPPEQGGGTDIFQFSSSGTSTVRGVSVTAELAFERQEESGEYVLRQVRVPALRINELEGNNLSVSMTHNPLDPLPPGSTDEYSSQTFEFHSGTIGGIYATSLVIDMPRTDDEQLQIRGEAGIESFSDVRVNAYIQDALNLGSAVIDGGVLRAQFLDDGRQIIDIGEPMYNEEGELVGHEGGLSITEGRVNAPDGSARLAARRLRGRVIREGDQYELENVRLGSLTLQQFNWRSGAKRFSANSPVIADNILVEATIDRRDPDNTQVQLDRIHVDSIQGNHFLYSAPPLEVEIRQDSGVRFNADVRGETAPPPLQIIDFDVTNVQWSDSGGMRAGRRPGEGNISVDSVHTAFDIVRNNLDLDVVIDTGDISLRFLQDGTRILNVEDLDTRVRGTFAEGVDADISVRQLDTGDVRMHDDIIEIPNMVIPQIQIDHLRVNTPSFELNVPQYVGGIQLSNTIVDADIQLAPEGSDLPFGSIEIFELRVPETVARNITVTIPDVEIDGETRDVTIRTDYSVPITISDLRLGGREEGNPFIIRPEVVPPAERQTNTDEPEIRFLREGVLHVEQAYGRHLQLGIENMLNVATDFEVTEADIGQLIDGSWTLDLHQLRLQELVGNYGQHHFYVSTNPAHGSAQEPAPAIVLSGLSRAADGTIQLDAASLTGIVYEQPDWGVRIDIQEVSLPRQLTIPPEGPFTIPALDITSAHFTVNDILNVGGGSGSSGGGSGGSSGSGGSILQDLNFLNALNGEVTVEIDLEYLPNDEITFGIEHGVVNLNDIENQLGYDAVVDFDLDGNSLILNLDWGNLVGGIAPLVPQANYKLLRWNDLSPDEQKRFDDHEEALMSTLVGRFDLGDDSGGGSSTPDPDPFAEIHNIRADLWMEETRVNLGDHGEIRLGGNGENGAVGIQVRGSIPRQIQLDVRQINASVNPENPLRFGGTSIDQGSIMIHNIHDTTLDFTGYTPSRLDGIVGGAEIRNLRIDRGGEQ